MPNININTTHTITCTDAPVEEVYAELDEKFPQLNPIIGQKLQLREERDDARTRANRLFEENKILSHDNSFATRRIDELADYVSHRISRISELQAMVADLTHERDEVQKRLEESLAVKEKLMAEKANLEAANEAILAGGSRPALPEGMRLAEHSEYGRVVVSPETNINRYYCIFASDDSATSKACYWYAKQSELTFLEEEPAPAPLPKPEDCKIGEYWLVEVFGEKCMAMKRANACHSHWETVNDVCDNDEVTLLARLLPDREVQA